MSKKLLALGLIIGLVAACGRGRAPSTSQGAETQAPPAAAPADTMRHDTMGLDTMTQPMTGQDTSYY